LSGWSKHGLIAVVLAMALPLAAQGLPNIQQFEVENARLVLLDKAGARQGLLEGKVARKKRDGKMEIQGAVLTIDGKEGKSVIRADSLQYQPDSEAFECPQGMTAEFPQGGGFEMPAATGSLHLGEGPFLKVTAAGLTRYRSHAQAQALLRTELMDPTIEIYFKTGAATPTPEHLTITGHRGGEFRVRVAAKPSPDGRATQPGVLVLACFGDINATLDQPTGKAALSMLRRARMSLEATADESPSDTLQIDANRIDLRGTLVEGKVDTLADRLTALEIDARESVHVSRQEAISTDLGVEVRQTFDGFGDKLFYREPPSRREVRLEGSPLLDLDQSGKTGTALLRMKARGYVSLTAPLAQPDTAPEWVELQLSSGAAVWRQNADTVEWKITGSQINLRSTDLPALPDAPPKARQRREVTFDVISEGYSPLLRTAGMSSLKEGPDVDPTQRAAVFGARANGRVLDDVLHARVSGPQILAVLYADFSLADAMRQALGLRKRPDKTAPKTPRPGRLAVRATETLDVAVSTLPIQPDQDAQPLMVRAMGQTEFEHTPLPRDDKDLVTFQGQGATLDMSYARATGAAAALDEIRLLELVPLAGQECLATLGYDLLLSHGFKMDMEQKLLQGDIFGPGRLVVRDADSLAYFRRAVQRLPRRGALASELVPDAGWLNFQGNIYVASDSDSRTLTAQGVEMRLVFGAFETPRTGPSGVKDLPELLDADVQPMYLVRGRNLLVQSAGYETTPPAVVNLLRLEGDALVRSEQDRVEATATQSMEASGSDDQNSAGNPLTVILLGSPVFKLEDAGQVFGDVVRRGSFAYDGAWNLRAGDRLEITFRPLAVNDYRAMEEVRASMGRIRTGNQTAPALLAQAETALQSLQKLVLNLGEQSTPESDQPRAALACARDVVVALQQAAHFESAGRLDPLHRARASRQAQRAEKLLSGLIEIAALGQVQGAFSSHEAGTPALVLSMQRAVVTFNGLGEVVDTAAQGPVRVTRGGYEITGDSLTQARDGALILDKAAILLPADTGVSISGVRSISLRQAPAGVPEDPRDTTLVTRVSGRALKVSVKLTKTEKKEAGGN